MNDINEKITAATLVESINMILEVPEINEIITKTSGYRTTSVVIVDDNTVVISGTMVDRATFDAVEKESFNLRRKLGVDEATIRRSSEMKMGTGDDFTITIHINETNEMIDILRAAVNKVCSPEDNMIL